MLAGPLNSEHDRPGLRRYWDFIQWKGVVGVRAKT